MIDQFFLALRYVAGAPYFWGSMGFTTAIAMFIGATMYDGQLTQVKKGLVSIFLYAFLLLQVTYSRIQPFLTLNGTHDPKLLAGIATIFLVTLFWCLGLFLGVLLFKKVARV